MVQVFPKSLNTSIYVMTHVNVVNERLQGSTEYTQSNDMSSIILYLGKKHLF